MLHGAGNAASTSRCSNYLVKALGEKGAEELRAKIRRLINGQESFALTRKTELSWLPTPAAQPKLGVMVRNTVANGHAEEYEKFVKANTTPVLAKTSAKGYVITRVGLGGNSSQYYSLLRFDSYADIEQYAERIKKARTEAGLLTAVPPGLLVEGLTSVVRYIPELSVAPAPQQPAK